MTDSSTHIIGSKWNGLRRSKRKPLPISSKPQFAVRVPLKRRSKKTEELYRKERVPLVKRLLAMYPMCQRCGVRRSTEIHEPKTRARGGSITDESNCFALCGGPEGCHRWIHNNIAEATKEGWLISRWA